MSFMFSKKKEKRSRSSTGESNSSFVKNVTSRVSGLLPVGITKWFSSPSSSSANGSAAIADGTDSSTEDEAPESPSMLQPPAKRIRYSSPVGKYSQLTTSETTTTSNVVTESGSVLYNSIQSPPGRHTFRRETNFVSTPIRAHSEDTTNMNSMMERSDRDPFTQHTVSAIGQSIAMKRKSLFDSHRQREQSLIACAKTAAHQVKDIKQPHFKPHLLGSPFYPGRTMYGGASASSTYMNHPNIKQRKMTYVNESRDAETVNMSTSSRRVMDLLENYSSPLIEAKRIPRYELSELGDINRSIQPSTSGTSPSYKTQELYIPSTATLIRMKARSRLMDSTKAARQIIASHSSTFSPYQPYASDTAKTDRSDSDSRPAKSQSKLKSRLTRANRGNDPFGMPEPVELPTAVLQIDKNNLPKFSVEGPVSEPPQKPINGGFKFSTPLPISVAVCIRTNTTGSRAPTFDFGSPEKAPDNTSPPKFSFGKQTSAEATQSTIATVTKQQEEPAKTSEKSVITFAKASNDWKCSGCWVSNKADAAKCVCCGEKQPPKCTTCKLSNCQRDSDKCVNCEKVRASTNPVNSLPVTKEASSSKWKCTTCWVNNEEGADKCICCANRKPGQSAPAEAPKPAEPTATTEKDWRCEDCLITNKPTVEKCAACDGAKPGTKPATKTLPSIASTNIISGANNIASKNIFTGDNNKIRDIFEAQKSSWECSVCLASNANDKLNCLCCDAERYTQDSAKPKFTNFKFNAETNIGFKFGIDPKVQETNLAKKIDTPQPKSTEESETNNNIVPKIPSFTFTLPAKKPAVKVDSPKTEEEPKPSFSFGIPKHSSTPVPITACADKLPDIVKPAEDKEKPQEVPSISFKALDATKASTLTGMFSSHAPTENPQNAMNAFLNNSAETKKSLPPSKSPAQLIAVTDETTPTFSFTSGAGGLFTTASTAVTYALTTQATPTPATTLAMGMFSKPEGTTTPAPSFFAKPDSKPAPSTLLFQNSAQSTPAAPTSSTSMFSFGNSQSLNPVPASEAKGFNFSFGSTTSTPAFSATPKPTSTFSLPAANPLTNGTNPLGGNGTAANPLARSITGNPLGGTGGTGIAPSGNGILGSSSAPIFNAPAKEGTSMWPSTTEQPTQANPFMASSAPKDTLFMASVAPKETFSFGSTPAPSPFGAQTSAPAKEGFSFGATASPSPFGAPASSAQPSVFGASAPAAQNNMFGMSPSQPSMFASPVASQPAPMFGSAQAASPAPAMSMFGAASASPFGASSAPMATFEAPSLTPAPAFNFGASQASSSVFGFGQQSQPQMQQPQMQGMQQTGIQQAGMQQAGMQQAGMQQAGMQQAGMQQAGIQPGMFNFSGAASPGPVQFSVGSGSSAAPLARRPVRRAVRRNQQR